MLLDGRLSPGQQVKVDARDGQLQFTVDSQQDQLAGAR
jgi:hypothetical protein